MQLAAGTGTARARAAAGPHPAFVFALRRFVDFPTAGWVLGLGTIGPGPGADGDGDGKVLCSVVCKYGSADCCCAAAVRFRSVACGVRHGEGGGAWGWVSVLVRGWIGSLEWNGMEWGDEGLEDGTVDDIEEKDGTFRLDLGHVVVSLGEVVELEMDNWKWEWPTV